MKNTYRILFEFFIVSLVALNIVAYPVGIHLGHEYVTSAFYTDSDKLIPLARIATSNEWQSLFMEAWKDPKADPHPSLSEAEIAAIFLSNVQQITHATKQALDEDFKIISIVLPNHLIAPRRVMVQAAIEAGILKEFQQATDHLRAAALAYDLDPCAGFQLPPGEECDLDDDILVLVINYEPERLSLAMVDGGMYGVALYNMENYPQFGENNGSILEPSQRQELSETLETYLERFDEDMEKKYGMVDELKNLRAIVLAGEASTLAMNNMNVVLRSSLPQYQAKLRTSLEPHFVGAFGAAQRARYIIHHPEFLRPADEPYRMGFHGEL